MTDADRKRLAAILGMLGSDSAGVRDAAALQAEAFRRKHALTWVEMLATPAAAPPPEPEPPPPSPSPPSPPSWQSPAPDYGPVAKAPADWSLLQAGLIAMFWVCIGWWAVTAIFGPPH
jgi:hypothetical protein